MFRKTVSAIMLSLLVISTLTLAFKIQSVKADSGTVAINSAPETFYFHSTPASTPVKSIDSWAMDFALPTGTLYSYTTGPGTGGADVVFFFGLGIPGTSPLAIDSGNWSCYVYVSETTVSSMIFELGESTGGFGELFTSLWTRIYWTPQAGWNTITWSDSLSRVVHAGNYLAIDIRAASSGSITLLWDTDTYDSRLNSPPAQSTLTSATCSPNFVSSGSLVTCTATVSGSNPTGTITWSTNSSTGSFTSPISTLSLARAPTLSSGSCSNNYTDTSGGSVTITASYSGDPNNTPSSGTCVLQVIQQYDVTFGQTGVGSDYTGTVVNIDGTDYAASDLPVSFSWDNGSTHTFAYQEPLVVSGGTPYYWASTSGLSTQQSGSITVAGPGSVTGNYGTDFHEVIVTNVTASTAWVYQGGTPTINVTVKNVGAFDESAVSVTVYYNETAGKSINTYPVNLDAGQNYTLTFTWNTAGVPCLNYTLTAVATIPIGSNAMSDGNITIKLLGDVNGDGVVNLKDIALVARAFGSTPSSGNWNPNADINGDGAVNMRDVALVARHFGNTDP